MWKRLLQHKQKIFEEKILLYGSSTMKILSLGEIIQLQTSHPVEISARYKLPYRDQLQINHPVEICVQNKSPCREFS